LARRQGDSFSLDAAALGLVPRALARRIVRRFLYEHAGGLRGFRFEDVENILALKEGKERPLGKWRVVRREAGRLRLEHPEKRPDAAPFEVLWDGKGKLELPGARGSFRGSVVERRDGTAAVHDGKKHVLRENKLPAYDDKTRALLNTAGLEFPLTVRSRLPGDKYRPLGAPGSKKLKEIFRAKKIPRADRDSLPVFLSGKNIAWVPGLPVAERFRLEPRTAKVFVIEKV
jgi:tRNA(Ile)-lysidine synthase